MDNPTRYAAGMLAERGEILAQLTTFRDQLRARGRSGEYGITKDQQDATEQTATAAIALVAARYTDGS